MMRRLARFAVLGAFVLQLAACAPPVGTDFVRPTSDTVTLGGTTEAEIRAKYGQPHSERAWGRQQAELAREVGTTVFGAARVSGTMSELYYYYSNRAGVAAKEGVSPSKSVMFWFYNGRLVGWQSTSSFRADSSAFDEKKVPEIQAWRSLRGDLVRLFGPPSGMRMYPMVPGEDQQELSWYLYENDSATHQTRVRRLSVLVNALGVVLDSRYEGSAKPIPLAPAPAYVPTPIYIPPPKRK